MGYVRLSDGSSETGESEQPSLLRSFVRPALLLASGFLLGSSLLAVIFASNPTVLSGHRALSGDLAISSSGTVTHKLGLEVGQGTSAHLYRLDWQNSTGSAFSLGFCSIRNLCITGRPEGNKTIEWSLNGQPQSAKDADTFSKIFKGCFWTQHKKDDRFSIRQHPQAEHISENTLAFFKDEPGNHPASWSRVWAPVTALLAKARDFLVEDGVRGITHVQLFEQPQKPNGWAAFVMNTALKTGQNGLDITSSWSDDNLFVNTTQTTCFDHIIATGENNDYFLDPEVSNAYRQTAYASIGLPPVRHPACDAAALRVVFLRRERPIWNTKDVIDTMRLMTPTVHVETITADTPYQVQVDIFAQADIVVSVHGSHLGNQIFMRPGAGMVEIFPHWFFSPEQERLAGQTGIDHVALVNNSLVPRELVTPDFIPLLDKLEQQIAMFPTAFDCMNHFSCRHPLALVGAYANIPDFKQKYHDLVQRVLHGCQ